MTTIDEDSRRRFERHRRAGGTDALEQFLPSADAGSFNATLEELVLIDLEMRWKTWHRTGAHGAAPSIEEYVARWPALAQPAVRIRLAEESAWLTEHYRAEGPRPDVQLGSYRLVERLGTGASAEVWRARDTELERDVALKIPNASIALGSQQMERAGREAQAAAGLRHPGIVTVYGVEEHHGRPFFALELVSGRTLAQALSDGAWPAEKAALLVARVADAIGYAHEVGVVHRDIKPANILLEADDRPRVTDFGLAQLASGRTELTHHGEVLGTPAYMAPEQARGATNEVGSQTDVYALGALLYELITGHKPFDGMTAEATLFKVVHEEPAPVRRLQPSLPVDLETITAKAMAKEPSRRYATTMELAADLRRYLAKRPIEARRTSLPGRIALWVRRNPGVAATMALALVAVGVVGALGLAGVFEERRRFRAQRDRAEANLFRSLLGEAEAVRTAEEVSWQDRAMDLMKRAAPLARTEADQVRVRTLVARCVSVSGPSFHRVADWQTGASAVTAVAPHPSGDGVATLSADGVVAVYEVPSGRRRASTPGGSSKPTTLAWMAQCGGLLIGNEDGRVELRDAETLEVRATTEPGAGAVRALAAAPTGETFAAGFASGVIEIVEWASGADGGGRTVHRLKGHEGGALALAFDAGGVRLLSGGRDRATRVWDCADGTELKHVTAHNVVRHVAFARGMHALYATYEQYSFRLWNMATGREFVPMTADGTHARPVTGMVVDRGGRVITSAADGSLSVWRVRSFDRHMLCERVHRALTPFGAITACRRMGNSRHLVAAHVDGRVSIWSLEPPTLAHRFRTGQEAEFLRGTNRLATTHGLLDYAQPTPQLLRFGRDPVIKLLARGDETSIALHASGRVVRGPREVASVAGATCMDATPDGRTLLVGTQAGDVVTLGSDGRRRSISLGRGAVFDVLAGTRAQETHLALTAGGLISFDTASRILDTRARASGALAGAGGWIAATADTGIDLIRRRDLEVARRVPGDHPYTAVALSDDGALLLGIDRRGTATLWRTETAEVVWTVAGNGYAGVSCLVDREEGVALLARMGSEVVSLDTGEPVAGVLLHAATLARDANRYVFGGLNGGAWFVRADRTRAVVRRLRTQREAGKRPVPPLLRVDGEVIAGGNPESTWGVAASPDGRWIATSGFHGETCLWDAGTLQQVRTIAAFGKLAWTVAFSSDSRTLAVGTGGTVRLYAVPDGTPRGSLDGHEHLVTSIAFHPTTSLVATSSQDGTIRLWDAEAGASRGVLRIDGARVSEVEFDPQGRRLVGVLTDGSVAFWSVAALADGAQPEARWEGHATALWTLAFDAEGRLLATGSEDGVILIRDAVTGARLLELASAPRLRSLSFSAGDRYLAAGCWSASSTTWDLVALEAKLDELGVGWR